MRATQILFQFEHDHRNAVIAAEHAKLKAKLDARAARKHAKEIRRVRGIMRKAAAQKRKAEREAKTAQWRRNMERAHRHRTPDESASCCGTWYCRSPKNRETGTYWHNCHKCQKPLTYTPSKKLR